MNAEQRELFRTALMRVLEANNTRFGIGPRALALLVNQYGFSPKVAEVDTELDYLEGKSLVTCVNKRISPENRCWRISSEGRDYIAALDGTSQRE